MLDLAFEDQVPPKRINAAFVHDLPPLAIFLICFYVTTKFLISNVYISEKTHGTGQHSDGAISMWIFV
jgi:hypothetical protein